MKCMIPSYNRSDRCRTASYLHKVGVPKCDIIIATQNESDFSAYTTAYGDIATIVYRQARNCAGNRNTLVSMLDDEEIALFLDDDLYSIQRYVMPQSGYGRLVDMGRKDLTKMFYEAERLINDEGAWLVGTAWNTNVINIYRAMRQGKNLSWNKTLSGATLFVKKHSGLKFDESLDCLDDTDLCLRYIYEGKNIVRVTEWAMNKPKDTTERGGCFEVYKSGKKIDVLKELDRRYFPLAKHKKDWTGMQVRAGLK